MILEVHSIPMLAISYLINALRMNSGKTQASITIQLHFVPHMDRLIFIHNGMITEEGTYESLISHAALFHKLVENVGKIEDETEESIPNGDHGSKLSVFDVLLVRK